MDILQHRPAFDSEVQQALIFSELRSKRALENLKKVAVNEFHHFWANPNPALTPEAQLLVMGNRAVAAFTAHGATVTFLIQQGVSIDPADYTPPRAYTAHEDGTITLD